MHNTRDTLFAFLHYSYLMILISNEDGRMQARQFYMDQAQRLIQILYPED